MRIRSCVWLVGAALLIPSSTVAQAVADDPNQEWTWGIVPFIWAADIAGEVSLGGQVIPVEEDFSEILEKVDLSVSLGFTAVRLPWSIRFTGTYSELRSESLVAPGTTAEVDTNQGIIELGVGHRVFQSASVPEDNSSFGVDVVAGVRGWIQSTVVQLPDGTRLVDQGENWFDPTAGLETFLTLGDRFTLRGRGDVGVFPESESTWSFRARGDVQATRRLALTGGFNTLDVNFDQGTGVDRYLYKMTLRGPFVGLVFQF